VALGVTALHPFWSVDREGWFPVKELKIGERLKGLKGTPRVESLDLRPKPEPVYNIEVEGDHCYRVGEQGLLVHNASPGASSDPDSVSAESNDPRTNRGDSNVHSNVPPYPGQGPTLGVFVAEETEVPLKSGGGPPGNWLVQNLQGGAGSGLNATIATHVEGHAAAIMHKHCIMDADLYINQAPCPRSAQCRFNLHKVLPAGSTLRVHFLEADGTTVSCWKFVAGQPRWQTC
jgi:hypothetical protein